eukprot:TRINITY_DN14838_c3_g1_i1.p1 TRINITY_DN14838_c3_g1~~TRINITY_DN14838_c3_g1_i1.p1  ORF type:complete len:315 (+),score=38.41 TRINITY_DN14838_c3_g1_i1:129-1073(+)
MSEVHVDTYSLEPQVSITKEFSELRYQNQGENQIQESSSGWAGMEQVEASQFEDQLSNDEEEPQQTWKQDEMNEDFLIHKVQKQDTLMSLAVKYNVTVQDLKRANNLLSDLSIYTKDSLLIPKKALPMDKDVMMRAAYIVSGYDRSVHFGDSSRKMPGTSALIRQAGPEAVKEYWESNHHIPRSFDFPGDIIRDDSILPLNGEHTKSDMIDYSGIVNIASHVKQIGEVAGGYIDDKLRRRWKEQAENANNAQIGKQVKQARQEVYKQSVSFGEALGRGAQSLSKKIQDAFNSPALAGPQTVGILDLSASPHPVI